MADDAQITAVIETDQDEPSGLSGNRVGCANLSNIVENVGDSPFSQPFFDDCYTTPLHNRDHDQGAKCL